MEHNYFRCMLEAHRKGIKKCSKLHDLGFDFYEGKFNLVHWMDEILKNAILSVYDEAGMDWVNWFIYENDYGKKGLEATDAEGNLIVQTYESLHEWLEKHHKIKKDDNHE